MQKYTCPMHPEVITDHPGNCPKCGMKLVPMKEKKRQRQLRKSRAGVQRSTSKVGAMESPAVASHPLRDPNRPGHEHEHPPSVAAATHGAGSEQEKMQKYTCPMHPEVITDRPGNCPKCGMKLVLLKSGKRPTPNVQHPTQNHAVAHGPSLARKHGNTRLHTIITRCRWGWKCTPPSISPIP